MTNTDHQKPSTIFWVVAILALLWNLMGVASYLMDAFMTTEAFNALPEEYRTLYAERPSWMMGAYAIAVWGGLLGSIALLAKKKWARPLFVISLAGVIAQQAYLFFMSNTLEVLGYSAMVLPIVVLVVAIFLVYFSGRCIARGWLK